MCTTWPGWSNSSSGWSHKLSPSCILSFSSSYSQLQGSPTSEQPLAHCKTITEKINKCTCLCLCIVKEYFSRSFYQGAERPPVQWCYVWEDLSLCQGKILLPSNWYSLITYLIFQRDQQHSEDITVQRERKGREDELKVLFENIELQKRWGYILVATCNLFSVIQENFVALGETLWWGEIEIKVFQGNQAKWYGFCWWWQIWKSSSLLY